MSAKPWVRVLALGVLFLAVSTFPQPPAYAVVTYVLTITPSSNGKVTVSPAMPAGGYPSGQMVSLMATANPGFIFSAWTGPNGAEVQPSVLTLWGAGTLVMNGDKTVGAAFTATDKTPPTGTIVINNNRSATNTPLVVLGLTWSDGNGGSGVSRMRFSDDGRTWTAWEPLAALRPHLLPPGDGHKTVRVQYLDRANNRSEAFNDYIRLDTTPPTGSIIINGGALTTMVRSVTLGLSWSDGNNGAGVTRMRFSDDGRTWTPWEPLRNARAHMLPPGLGHHTVRVQFMDGANNHSAAFNDYIKLVAPNPHLVPTNDDKDGDYLSDAEERALGSDPAQPDEDRNGVPDGVDLARQTAKAIGGMPWFEAAGDPEYGLYPPELEDQFPADRPYVIRFDYLVDCVWVCPVCNTALPVGHLQVVNPAVHASWRDGFRIPVGAWHYLGCGAFTHPGLDCANTELHRLDVPGLAHVVSATPENMKGAQWIARNACPKEWGVEILPLAGPLNGIRIAGPTQEYSNDCVGNVALGGSPHVAINPAARTLTLVAIGPPPQGCITLYAPVCGLETIITGIASGAWTFSAPMLDPPVQFSFTIAKK
ncbi:MAG: hypothetical protein H3C30_13630 [Candidatus Hydrogenedentes bacterium]|nr:hypothetical protein [Candidatus Hydrogenedentota bacterium]